MEQNPYTTVFFSDKKGKKQFIRLIDDKWKIISTTQEWVPGTGIILEEVEVVIGKKRYPIDPEIAKKILDQVADKETIKDVKHELERRKFQKT